MSKAQWPKIRAKKYRWQDKNGTNHKAGRNLKFKIDCQVLIWQIYKYFVKNKRMATKLSFQI